MKLMVVEDEEYVLHGILDRLDLSALGIEKVEAAFDGEEALEKAQLFSPDILLTDIRMPHVDGITIARRLKEANRHTKVIFMSDHMDKAYLRAAIELNAVQYLERPLEIKDVSSALQAAVEQLREERLQEAVMEAAIPALETELAARLADSPQDNRALARLVELTGSTLSVTSRIVAVMFRIGPCNPGSDAEPDTNVDEFVRFVRSSLSRSPLRVLISARPKHIVMAHFTGRNESDHVVTQERVAQAVRRFIHGENSQYRAVAGIGTLETGLHAVPNSARTATLALDRAFFGGYGNVVLYSRMDKQQGNIDDTAVTEYAHLLQTGNLEKVTRTIERVVETMCIPPYPSALDARSLFHKMYLRLMLFEDEKGIQSPQHALSVWTGIESAGTVEEIAGFLQRETMETLTIFREIRENGRVVSEIKRFILEKYSDPSTCVQAIAQAVNLSPAYVCTRFKAGTGKTINGYLTEVRVARAKEMLTDPGGPKISEIATRVGWTNADYFARVFRKATAHSPSEFREQLCP